jgi:hypothetical protein
MKKINPIKYQRNLLIILGLCSFLLFPHSGLSQKIKVDGYKITIQKNPTTKKMNMHGKTYISYKGKVKVCSKDSLKGMYTFSYIDLGNDIANIKFKGVENNMQLPKLIFDASKGVFSYNKKNGEEGTLQKEVYLPFGDAVLQAILISIKIKQGLPIN